MVKVSVIYPNVEGKRFDMDYYCNKHITLIRERTGGACLGAMVDQGVSGPVPGSKPEFIAMAHLLFDSIESIQASFLPHAPEFMADIPNYTDIEPVIQISEVKM